MLLAECILIVSLFGAFQSQPQSESIAMALLKSLLGQSTAPFPHDLTDGSMGDHKAGLKEQGEENNNALTENEQPPDFTGGSKGDHKAGLKEQGKENNNALTENEQPKLTGIVAVNENFVAGDVLKVFRSLLLNDGLAPRLDELVSSGKVEKAIDGTIKTSFAGVPLSRKKRSVLSPVARRLMIKMFLNGAKTLRSLRKSLLKSKKN